MLLLPVGTSATFTMNVASQPPTSLLGENLELLLREGQRFAGAMGLDYNNVPGIANYVRNPEG